MDLEMENLFVKKFISKDMRGSSLSCPRKNVNFPCYVFRIRCDFCLHHLSWRSGVPKRIYIMQKKEIRFQIDMNFSVVKQLILLVPKEKIRVYFNEETLRGFPKRYRDLLEPVLKPHQRRKMIEHMKKRR